MGRNAAVTYDLVCVAAARLRAAGKSIGAKAIRQELGYVGSLGTIQKFLQQMLIDAGEQPAVTRVLPPDLQRAVLKFADEEGTRCHRELAAELEIYRRGAEDLATDNEFMDEQISQLHSQNENLTILNAGLEGQLSRLLEELTTARNESAKARHNAERDRTKLATAQLRLQDQVRLNHDLRQLRTDYAAQRQALVRSEQSAAVLASQKVDLEQRLIEFKMTTGERQRAESGPNEERDGSVDRKKRTAKNSGARDKKSASKQTPGGRRSQGAAPLCEINRDEKLQPNLF